MPEINKIYRSKNIKQVSRIDELKPSEEKPITKVIPKIESKTQIKADTENSVIGPPVNTPLEAAKKASIATIRHTKTLSESSDKQADQEAIDKIESFTGNTLSDTTETTLIASDSIKRQIKKKNLVIRNQKDINKGTRTIKKADNSIRVAQKSAAEATKVAHKSATEAAKQTVIATQKIASAKKAERLAKKSADWVKKIVKEIKKAIESLLRIISGASVVLLLILILASLIAAIVASAFGIFFAGDTSAEETRTLQEVVLEINAEFNAAVENIENTVSHDEVTKEGYQAPWPEVLSVYSVYVTTKTDGATDVVHLTDEHVEILKDIFWQMNTITYTTEVVKETIQVPDLDSDGNQKKDKDGNLLYKEETVSKTILHISINHLTATEEASKLSFNTEQITQLNELLDARYASLWSQLLKGVGDSSELVNLALSQLGNEGGEKYWRWAGLDTRCEWCALFVSWCAEQTGLMDSEQIPYFSFVSDGVDWFKDKGRWIDGADVNSSNYDKKIYPGMIIFFDWEPDGKPNHVGIVTKVSDGYIYTVEGNKGDAVAEGTYSADSIYVFGFGAI